MDLDITALSDEEMAKNTMDRMEELFSIAPDIRQFIEQISKNIDFELSHEAATDLCDITEQYLAGCRSAMRRSDLQDARARFKKIRKIISDAHARLEEEFIGIRCSAVTDATIKVEENGRWVELNSASGQLGVLPVPKNDLAVVWRDLENCINLGSSGRLGGFPTGLPGPLMGLPIDRFLHDLEQMTVCLDDHLSRWDERYGAEVVPPAHSVLKNFVAQLVEFFEKCGNDLFVEDKAQCDEVRGRFYLLLDLLLGALPKNVHPLKHSEEAFNKLLRRTLADCRNGKVKVRFSATQQYRKEWESSDKTA
ncbi:MAG: hypothetical protein ACLPWS_17955 [Rhodomicrobium sp.]